MDISASSDPGAKAPGFRKSLKFGMSRLLGGSLEQMMFQWRRLSMRVNVWLGRPYTALYGMDRKLEKYLDFRGGTFIEAGANDGIAQSNSYFLENKHGWNGVRAMSTWSIAVSVLSRKTVRNWRSWRAGS